MASTTGLPLARAPIPQRTRLAYGMAFLTAAFLVGALALIALSPSERVAQVSSIGVGQGIALCAAWMAFAIVGAIIVRHQPDNAVGWLCCIAGLQVSTVALTVGIATYALSADPPWPIGTTVAWAAHVGSIAIVLAPLLILFRFPTGRSLGPWWHRAEGLRWWWSAFCWSSRPSNP